MNPSQSEAALPYALITFLSNKIEETLNAQGNPCFFLPGLKHEGTHMYEPLKSAERSTGLKRKGTHMYESLESAGELNQKSYMLVSLESTEHSIKKGLDQIKDCLMNLGIILEEDITEGGKENAEFGNSWPVYNSNLTKSELLNIILDEKKEDGWHHIIIGINSESLAVHLGKAYFNVLMDYPLPTVLIEYQGEQLLLSTQYKPGDATEVRYEFLNRCGRYFSVQQELTDVIRIIQVMDCSYQVVGVDLKKLAAGIEPRKVVPLLTQKDNLTRVCNIQPPYSRAVINIGRAPYVLNLNGFPSYRETRIFGRSKAWVREIDNMVKQLNSMRTDNSRDNILCEDNSIIINTSQPDAYLKEFIGWLNELLKGTQGEYRKNTVIDHGGRTSKGVIKSFVTNNGDTWRDLVQVHRINSSNFYIVIKVEQLVFHIGVYYLKHLWPSEKFKIVHLEDEDTLVAILDSILSDDAGDVFERGKSELLLSMERKELVVEGLDLETFIAGSLVTLNSNAYPGKCRIAIRITALTRFIDNEQMLQFIKEQQMTQEPSAKGQRLLQGSNSMFSSAMETSPGKEEQQQEEETCTTCTIV